MWGRRFGKGILELFFMIGGRVVMVAEAAIDDLAIFSNSVPVIEEVICQLCQVCQRSPNGTFLKMVHVVDFRIIQENRLDAVIKSSWR